MKRNVINTAQLAINMSAYLSHAVCTASNDFTSLKRLNCQANLLPLISKYILKESCTIIAKVRIKMIAAKSLPDALLDKVTLLTAPLIEAQRYC